MPSVAAKRRISLFRLALRDKRAGVEFTIVAESALKPNRKLMRDLQLMKRFTLCPGEVMHGVVAKAAHLVKQITLGRADCAPVRQGIDDPTLLFARVHQQTNLGRRTLR